MVIKCNIIERRYVVYYVLFSYKMQVPLHLLCDDLLLYQEVTGNMYKLYLKSDRTSTDLSLSPKW